MNDPRKPIRPERVRTVPRSFSWIDRDLLHQRLIQKLTQEEILLYFFLVLVAGPEGTSFWSYRRIAKILKLSEYELCAALRGLIAKDLVAFHYPTFQVLSLPPAEKKSAEGRP
jgi:hypothetical protein